METEMETTETETGKRFVSRNRHQVSEKTSFATIYLQGLRKYVTFFHRFSTIFVWVRSSLVVSVALLKSCDRFNRSLSGHILFLSVYVNNE